MTTQAKEKVHLNRWIDKHRKRHEFRSRNYYKLVNEDPLHIIDLSMIPTPQTMKEKLQNVESGSSESE